MFKKNKILKNGSNRRGFVALFPAVIISGILLILCVGASLSFLALLYRSTLFEEKTQSDVDVAACVLRVSAKITQNSSYAGGEEIFIGDDVCEVQNFSTSTAGVSVKIGDAVSFGNVSR